MTATRSFVRTARAWYGGQLDADTPEEFILAQGTQTDLERGEDAPQLEVVMRWHTGRYFAHPAAKLTLFDESWQALAWWRDLWDALALAADAAGGMKGDFHLHPDDFQAILTGLGFEDRTPTERPT